ncbi:MAG: C40 family peptidase, partial [Bdellovibrio sp.]|nr:C40 family peptidase [Bdellovibrio sp.]
PEMTGSCDIEGDGTLACTYQVLNYPIAAGGMYDVANDSGGFNTIDFLQVVTDGHFSTAISVFIDKNRKCGTASPVSLPNSITPCISWDSNISAGTYKVSYVITGRPDANTVTYQKKVFTLQLVDSKPKKIAAVPSKKGCSVPSHSSINMDSLALQESIPVTGVPFYLGYSSDRFQAGVAYTVKAMGLGGWTPSLMHYYDKANKIVYFGDGSLRPIAAVTQGTGFIVSNETGSEVYYFDATGHHTQTRDAMTGVVKWTFAYDSSKRISSIKDAFGNTSAFQYSGSQVSIVSPYAQTTKITLNAKGNLSAVVNPNKETYTVGTTDSGLLISYQKPGGQKSTVTYDAEGYVQKDQGAGGDFLSIVRQFDSAKGVQTVTTLTALNRKTVYSTSSADGTYSHTVTRADGASSSSKETEQSGSSATDFYGAKSSKTSAKDPRFGWMSSFVQKDSYAVPNTAIAISNQRQRTVKLSNAQDLWSMTQWSETTTQQGDSTRVSSVVYDGTKKMFTSKSPLGRVQYATLNAKGQIANIQQGSLVANAFTYDAKGRLITVDQGGRKMTATYDAAGNISSITDPVGRKTQYIYNASNRLIKKILPDGGAVVMAYDANGNLTSLTPPAKTPHTFSYNLYELVSKYLPPALSGVTNVATAYSYNNDMQLTAETRPDGSQIKYSYDSAGRMTAMSLPGGNYTYTYLSKSDLVKSATSLDGVILDYEYAASVPLAVKTSGPVGSTVRYSYNPDGTISAINVAGATGAASNVAISYDKDSLPVKLGDEALTINASGLVTATKLQNITATVSYDTFGQAAGDAFIYNKANLLSHKYSRDSVGRVVRSTTTKGTAIVTQDYTYDHQGRLMLVAIGGKTSRQYSYDMNGNRVQVSTGSSIAKAKYDTQDRLTNYGTLEYKYTANGELTTKVAHTYAYDNANFNTTKDVKKTTAYTYDVLGNLQVVTLPDGKKVEYIVDAQNRRVGKKVNGKLTQGFVYQSQTQIAAELDANGSVIKRFVYGTKSNTPDYMVYKGVTYQIISNQVGTPELLVDASSGKVVESLSFDEFGIPSGNNSSILPFGFAGGLLDRDTGLVRFGVRDYDPVTARWTAKDPIGFAGGDTSLYNYTWSDPINFIDSSGFEGISSEEGAMIAVQASTWQGTPYKYGGSKSGANGGADCSNSTNQIFAEAGYPYPMSTAGEFAKNKKFAPVEGEPQAGDVGLFDGHLAIYDPNLPNGKNIWSATHTGGAPYGPSKSKWFGSVKWYRYQK